MYELRKYHGDRVQSLTYDDDGLSFSVGIISTGEYQFGSVREEIFTVTHGAIAAWMEGGEDYRVYNVGETFVVPASRNFNMKVSETSAYICYYR